MILELPAPPASEPESRAETLVLFWRIEQFQRLGFTDVDSWALARSDADLGVARSIRRAHCPIELALQILA